MKNQSKSKSSNRKLGVVVLGLIKQKGIVKLPLRVEEYKSEKICHKSEDFLDFGNLMRDFLSVYPYEESDEKKQIIEIEISEEDYNRLKKILNDALNGDWEYPLRKWKPNSEGAKTRYLYSYLRLGKYDRTNKKIILYMNTIKKYCKEEDKEKLIHTIHIHELFHAYFHFVTEQIHRKQYNYIPEIEEAMAEFSTLVCLKEMSDNNIHPDSVEILNFAQKEIEEKQNEVGFLAAYGFGAYLYDTLEEKERFKLINNYIEKLGDIDVNDDKVKEFIHKVRLSKFVPGNQEACLELLREILESPKSRHRNQNTGIIDKQIIINKIPKSPECSQGKKQTTIMSQFSDNIKKDIQQYFDVLNTNPVIFSNELHLQMHLARYLENAGYTVLYEYNIPNDKFTQQEYPWQDKNGNPQKMYLDLVVKNDDEFVPIEIKYKTRSIDYGNVFNDPNCGPMTLKDHGAQDLGRYGFWNDVYRLELVKRKFAAHVQTGIALFVTNDKLYKMPLNPKNKNSVNFAMGDGTYNYQKSIKNCEWPFDPMKRDSYKSCPNFTLKNIYEVKWNNYKCGNEDFYWAMVTV